MDYHFALAASHKPDWGQSTKKQFGFVSRTYDENIVERLRVELDPTGSKTIVYFGLGMKIFMDQLKELPLWDSPDCIFVVSSNVEVHKDNVYKIPEDYTESQHFIAASDLVITKAGWSTIAEAVNSNKPLIVLNRNHMEEDQNTIQYLKEHQRAQTMEWQEIKNLIIEKNLLMQVDNQKSAHSSVNDCGRITKGIIDIIFGE
ncbi:glycosyltransferase [Neobacillus sp. Marseille-QA0830]